MKIVLAPDSFKECLGASAVASALGEGVLSVVPQSRVDLCPMADGGEGTVEAMVSATGGRFLSADVFGPLGSPIRARFGILGSGGGAALPGEIGYLSAVVRSEGEGADGPDGADATAVIEMAAASGLALILPENRDPLRTTTFGTGQLIKAALEMGARRIIVGIGGSGTVDGGCGCAQALGVVFTDSAGKPVVSGMGGGALAGIASIDITGRDPRLGEADIVVACDVQNPFTGPDGAAAVYGPQKGATEEVVGQLEAGLAHLAEAIRSRLGLDVADLPGAGAAGGLGAGLAAFADAKLDDGVEIVAKAVGLKDRLVGADLCITGEGLLDAQSASGKTTVGVARIARDVGVTVVCIPGQVAADAPRNAFDFVLPLVDGTVSPRQAMTHAEKLLKQRAADAVRKFIEES